MVFFFTSSDGTFFFHKNISNKYQFKGHVIYMGKDKFENEELLRWGWPEDCK